MDPSRTPLPKSPTGIQGLDDITGGGLPTGRPTLVCGSAGCGKTLLAMEFLVRGATQFDEPGVFMAFEETVAELTANVASLGFDLDALVAARKLELDFVYIERSEIEETGEFDLEGLFVRLGYAIDAIGARRVVLDTLESLFAGLPNPLILRAELRRLFRWLKSKGVTAIITGERGDGALTRQGLEEYVSDCVILLDHHVNDLICTRRLRVVKYRGSTHGTNAYPFLIGADGLSVLPITSLSLDHDVCDERVSSGIDRLDAMLGGGYYRGSSILVSGTAGTGKTLCAGHFVQAACRRGEAVLYFAFEESPNQILRNLRSVGIDLAPWVQQGRLHFQATRPSFTGLEMHLAGMHRAIADIRPSHIVMDPLNAFISPGNETEVKAMLMRLIDYLKADRITGFFTSLTTGGTALDRTDTDISSLIDTWLILLAIESGGERNRALSILKSRGMAHSNQTREFLLTDDGLTLRDVYIGLDGVLTGSARLARESEERAAQLRRRLEIDRQQRELARKRALMEAQTAALRLEFEAQEADILDLIERLKAEAAQLARERTAMASSRQADVLAETDGTAEKRT